MKKLRFFTAVAAAVLSLAAAVTGFAEGSKDLVDINDLPKTDTTVYNWNGGEVKFDRSYKPSDSDITKDLSGKGAYRPFLEWKQSGGKTLLGRAKRSVIYAYIKQGEYVFLGSSLKESKNQNSLKSVFIQDDTVTALPNITFVGDSGSASAKPSIAVTLPSSDGSTEAAKPSITNDNKAKVAWGGSRILTEKNFDTVYVFNTNSNGQGYIANPKEESIGPDIKKATPNKDMSNKENLTNATVKNSTGVVDTTGGYNPISFIAPYTGVYSFRFLSNEYISDSNPTPMLLKEIDKYTNEELNNFSWGQGDGAVAAWDITIAEKNGNEFTIKEGRVGADIMFLSVGGHQKGVYSKLYTITDDGFVYKLSLNGMQPFGFGLYSNNRGFLMDHYNLTQEKQEDRPSDAPFRVFAIAKPLAHSFYAFTSGSDVGKPPVREEVDGYGNVIYDGSGKPIRSSILDNLIAVDPDKDKTNKMMFNYPDTDYVEKMTKAGAVVTTKAQAVADKNGSPIKTENISYYGYGLTDSNGNDAQDLRYKDGDNYVKLNEGATPPPDKDVIPFGPYGQGGDFRFLLANPAAYDNLKSKTFRIVLDFSKYALGTGTSYARVTTTSPILDNTGHWVLRGETIIADLAPTEIMDNNKVTLTAIIPDPHNFECNKTSKDLSRHKTDSGGNIIEHPKEEYTMLVWDGCDAYGNPVPKGIYNGLAQCSWEAGTAHFPLLDVEYMPNGVVIERMNVITDGNDTEEKRYTVYYNNEGTPKADDPTDWYFTDETKELIKPDKFPTKIADGLNHTNGTSSQPKDGDARGAMYYTGQYTTKTTYGYGDFTALDIWTNYIGESVADLTIGVQADPKDYVINPATVSFVGENADTKLNIWKNVPAYSTNALQVTPSLEPIGSHTRVGYLAPVERTPMPVASATPRPAYNVGGTYGNTISTGFIATVSDGVDDLGDEGIAKYDKIAWGINIPIAPENYEGMRYQYKSMNETAVDSYASPIYIKVKKEKEQALVNGEEPEEFMISLYELFGEGAFNEEVELGAEGDVEEIGGDVDGKIASMGFTAVTLETTEDEMTYELKGNATNQVQLVLDKTSCLTDAVGNTIYKVKGVKLNGTKKVSKLRMQFQYKLDNKSWANKDTLSATYGLIIDDLYAPSAHADVSIYYKNQKENGEYDESTNASRVNYDTYKGIYQVTNKDDYNVNGIKEVTIITPSPSPTPAN